MGASHPVCGCGRGPAEPGAPGASDAPRGPTPAELQRLREENAAIKEQLERLQERRRGGGPGEAEGGEAAPEALSPTDSLESSPSHFTGPVAGSLNTIAEQFWGQISRYTPELIAKEVQPALQDALPSALQGLRFEAERCNLGQRPLEFRRVFIRRETQKIGAGHIQNLVFKARIEWDADCKFSLTFAGTSFGIRGLRLKGVLVFSMVGMMDRPPFFGGVRVFFNNPPELDVDFAGAGEHVLNLGLVRRKIVDVVTSSISDTLVVPNRFGYSLTPEADIFDVKSPPAEGILKVTVWSAQGLLPMDIGWLCGGTSDPYVIVSCGGFRFRSPTKYRTLAPDFSYTVPVPVSESAHQRVCLQLYDQDRLSSDDFLGRVSLPVKTMMSWGGQQKFTIKLQDDRGERGKNGSLCVSAEWRPLLSNIGGGGHSGPGLVFAGVASAAHLPRLHEQALYWVKVRCTRLFADFPQEPRETGHVGEPPPPEFLTTPLGVAAMRARLEVCQSYNMSDADMAKVLEVDEGRLQQSLLHRSKTEAAGHLSASMKHEIQWDFGYDFPVETVVGPVLTFEVWGQAPSDRARLLGTYQCEVAELTSFQHGTCWRTAEVPHSDILLKLKLAVRYLGSASQ